MAAASSLCVLHGNEREREERFGSGEERLPFGWLLWLICFEGLRNRERLVERVGCGKERWWNFFAVLVGAEFSLGIQCAIFYYFFLAAIVFLRLLVEVIFYWPG